MRSHLVFQAMRNIPNRFTLCSMTTTYLRKVHSNDSSFSQSINMYFESVCVLKPQDPLVTETALKPAPEN